jgi:hypothetical protein
MYIEFLMCDNYIVCQMRARRKAHTGFWWGNHLKDPGVDERIILKFIFEKWDGRTWTGSIWLRIGTGGGLL